ncbi:MAG: hypothetical protein HQ463_05160 [Bacteroidetes bacterium]|nr:hypothetical protein [Bacteroidota bacterium]
MKLLNLLILISIICGDISSSKAVNKSIQVKKPKDNGLSIQIENIRKRELGNFGNIIENEVVVGYYMFKKNENIGGGKATFQIEIFDENLKSKKTFKLEKAKKALLVEMCYNGQAFLIIMTNKKGIDLITYDKEGKKLGEKNIIKESLRMPSSLQSEQSGISTTIYPIGENGFYRQSFVKNKKLGFTVEAFSNTLKPYWKYNSVDTSKEIEAVDILYASKNYLALLHTHKKTLYTKEINNDFLFLDGSNGKKMFSLPMKEISNLSVQGCYVNEEKKEVILNGEYFAKGDKIYYSKSEGLYLMKLNLNGEELKMEKLNWKKDLVSLTTTDVEKGKSKENMRFYIHKVFNDSLGNTYIIAEQYKYIISALGVVSKLTSIGDRNLIDLRQNKNPSEFSIKIYNIVCLVLDKDFIVKEEVVIKKKFSEFHIPEYARNYSPTELAHYIKVNNNFDYQFTTINKSKTEFTAFYIDLNRIGEDNVIGTISLSGGVVENKRTPFTFNTEFSTANFFYLNERTPFTFNTELSNVILKSAKQGYILIGEFWPIKKQLNLRLEAIN